VRGTVVGIIDGLNEVLVRLDDDGGLERGDVVIIEKPKELRSKNANALYWELNGRLAKKLNISGEIIYKNHIKDISCRECYLMETKAVEKFKGLWCSGHLGRFVDTRESREAGKTIVLAYYGSSDFDSMQMYHLIENIIDDCRLNDVPTYNQDEINEAVSKWAKSTNRA